MRILVLMCCLSLAGCATSGAILEQGVARGAEAYDKALLSAEAVQCRIGSVRSVLERYARDPEMWRAWLKICGYAAEDIERPVPEK